MRVRVWLWMSLNCYCNYNCNPSTLSSSASQSPGQRRNESQSPLSMQAETCDRTEKPVVGRDTSYAPGHHQRFVESSYSASYSGWDDDKTWSSQEWKAGDLMDDRTVKPVVCPQRGARAQQFVIGDDETELDLSLGPRSFLDRVNDQVRKRQTIFDECYRRRRKTFCDMGNVHVFIIGVICIHGKELLRQLALHQEHRRSHNETDVRHI